MLAYCSSGGVPGCNRQDMLAYCSSGGVPGCNRQDMLAYGAVVVCLVVIDKIC